MFCLLVIVFFFSSRRRHTSCALVTGVQTCALPILPLYQFRNMASTFAMLGAGTGAQPFRSVRDYDNWLARAARIPALFDQAIANMREGVAQGDRKSVVSGKRVSVRVDLGGRRILKKKKSI